MVKGRLLVLENTFGVFFPGKGRMQEGLYEVADVQGITCLRYLGESCVSTDSPYSGPVSIMENERQAVLTKDEAQQNPELFHNLKYAGLNNTGE